MVIENILAAHGKEKRMIGGGGLGQREKWAHSIIVG